MNELLLRLKSILVGAYGKYILVGVLAISMLFMAYKFFTFKMLMWGIAVLSALGLVGIGWYYKENITKWMHNKRDKKSISCAVLNSFSQKLKDSYSKYQSVLSEMPVLKRYNKSKMP